MKKYTNEEVKKFSPAHTLDMDTTLVVRYKVDASRGVKLPVVEEAYKLSEIINKLKDL